MEFKNIPQGKINRISFSRPDVVDSQLVVITPVFNTPRFKTVWKHYNEFAHYVLSSGAYLLTIEYALGERAYAITETLSDKHSIINTRGTSELWLKENLVNRAIMSLPEDVEYIAVIDSDIRFLRSDWCGEAIQSLQHYDVVQMFESAQDLDINNVPYQFNSGFVHDWLKYNTVKMQFSKNIVIPNVKISTGKTSLNNQLNPYCDECDDGELRIHRFHPGYAWCYKKSVLSKLGGLFDLGILGAGDAHFATALVGHVMESVHPKMSEEYKQLLQVYQDRAIKAVNYNIGFMNGTISHAFHGSKKHRKYGSRWKILVDNNFTPSTDIKRVWNGIYQLEGNKPPLTSQIRQYFKERNSDSIDMEGAKGFLD